MHVLRGGRFPLVTLFVVTAALAAPPPPAPAPPVATSAAVTSLLLPGAPADGVALDYLVVDRARHRVWVPAGGTGSADVIDTRTQAISRVEKFPVADVERNGKKRKVGPSSATVGDGVVYVGDRADSSVCAVDAVTLERRGCATLASMPDGVAFVAATKEVWVTTPRDQSIVILDVKTPGAPKTAGRITLDGDPEGYAVDDAHGFFYTNLEDKDRTLRISTSCRRKGRCTPRRPARRRSPSPVWTKKARCCGSPRARPPRERATPSSPTKGSRTSRTGRRGRSSWSVRPARDQDRSSLDGRSLSSGCQPGNVSSKHASSSGPDTQRTSPPCKRAM